MSAPDALKIPALLTRKDVANLLGCTVKTVSNMTKKGVFNPIRLGARMLRYEAAEVAAIIEKSKH